MQICLHTESQGLILADRDGKVYSRVTAGGKLASEEKLHINTEYTLFSCMGRRTLASPSFPLKTN